jgi:hypothetical protein
VSIVHAAVSQKPLGHAREAHDVDEHAQERRTREVRPLSEDRIEALAGPLDPLGGALHGEGHVALLVRDAEPLEEADEVRVGTLVVDHEAGIGRDGCAAEFHVVRVCVSSEPVVCFEEVDLVCRREEPRRSRT